MTHTKQRNSHRNHSAISNDVEKIKMAIAHATRSAKGKAGDVFYDSMDALKDKTLDAQDAVETYVTKKPFKSIGIALLAGTVLGLLLRRK